MALIKSSENVRNREGYLSSIETFRTIFVFAVIITHFRPGINLVPDLARFILCMANFAIPFFLCISGYLFFTKYEQKANAIEVINGYAKRYAFTYFAWFLFYATQPDNGYIASIVSGNLIASICSAMIWTLQYCIHNPISCFLIGGNGFHLWYLPALFISLLACGVFLHLKWDMKYLLILAVVLFVLYLISRPYKYTIVGVNLNYIKMYGPFGLIFFVIGAIMAKNKYLFNTWLSLLIAVVGISLYFIEVKYLSRYPDFDFVKTPILPSCIIFVIGFIPFLVANPKFGNGTLFSSLGKYSFGIYVIHLFVMHELNPLVNNLTGITKIVIGGLMPFIIYFISLFICILMSTNKKLKWLVGKGW